MVWKTLNGFFMILSSSHLHSRCTVWSDNLVWICSNTMQTFPVYEALNIEMRQKIDQTLRFQVRLGFTCIFFLSFQFFWYHSSKQETCALICCHPCAFPFVNVSSHFFKSPANSYRSDIRINTGLCGTFQCSGSV